MRWFFTSMASVGRSCRHPVRPAVAVRRPVANAI